MNSDEFVHQLDNTLMLVLTLSAPVLLVAAGVGLLVGLLQAVTQIQDQSLPQVLKLVAVLVTLALIGPSLAGPLVHQTEAILDRFPAIVR